MLSTLQDDNANLYKEKGKILDSLKRYLGTTKFFSVEQVVQIVALAGESPEKSAKPRNHLKGNQEFSTQWQHEPLF